MKKNYEVEGMSCGGCVNSVKKALLKVPEVTDVEIQLNQNSAVITMNKSIAEVEFQNQLASAGHYSIKEISIN
jgi:copper chaperone CopZ